MQDTVKNHNVCGVLVSVNSEDFNVLNNFLAELKGCEVVANNGENQLALVVEDQLEESAYDIMESIKNHSTVLSVTLVNHFFEKL